MTIKEFKEKIKDLPDETEMVIYNSSFEWYGEEPLPDESWKVIDGKLILHFGLQWDQYETEKYLEETL